MSIMIRVTSSELDLSGAEAALKNRGGLHARLATAGEDFVKKRGAVTAADEHKTARALGASPTNHLVAAYKAIESESNEEAALLLVPRNTRLRAAFGAYTIEPGPGKTYLTIPVNRESYGRSAGEFSDLFFVRVGPKKSPVLARSDGNGGLETMFFLTTKAEIPEDKGLIPFDDLADEARDSAEDWILEQLERAAS